ncbi:MAG: magnesium and cobalt transport protein CorA [Planctomycetia bacterium]|nr:magnesium and cobalt transport protein CorA [Planctomycetia bacterium]
MSKRKHRRRRHLPALHETASPSGQQEPGQPTILRLTACDGTTCHESTVLDPAELALAREKWPVVWLDVDGFEDLEAIRAIGRIFEIGDLALEDAITPDERPKVEVFGHQLLIAVRMARLDGTAIVTDPMAIFLGDRYVITFHDRTVPDGFIGVRERIRHGRTRLGQGHQGADHLCAILLDAAIDGYFPVLESFGDRLEEIEDAAIENPSRDLLGRIHDVRNDLMTLRRALWPTRDVLHALGRESTAFVGDHARQHFRDTYDHTMELLDITEGFREIGSDLRDIYLASVSNRMNDVMKVLTVIATIFMPLTFITGWYGMNFNTASPWNMPLLNYRFGSLVAAGIMLVSTFGMVAYRGWLRRWH